MVTAIAILAVIYLMIKEQDMKVRLVSYTLILSGAVGNFIDRVYMGGKVVDFLHFYYNQYQWPAFNVADMAISVGISLLFIDYIILKKRGTKSNFVLMSEPFRGGSAVFRLCLNSSEDCLQGQ